MEEIFRPWQSFRSKSLDGEKRGSEKKLPNKAHAFVSVPIPIDRILHLIRAVSLVVRQLDALLVCSLIRGPNARFARKLRPKTTPSSGLSSLLEGVSVPSSFLAVINHLQEEGRRRIATRSWEPTGESINQSKRQSTSSQRQVLDARWGKVWAQSFQL